MMTSQSMDQLKEQVAELEKVNRELQDQLEQQKEEHRKIEAAIERGKREWEATFDAVADMVILTDSQGMTIRCNQSASRYLNKPYSEIVGNYISHLLFGTEEYDKRLFDGEAKEVQFPLLPGWFDLGSYPVLMKGLRFGVVHIIRDITERRMAQQSLRESEERLRKINDELELRVLQRTSELRETNLELAHEVDEREKIQAILAKEKDLLSITLLSIRDGVVSVDKEGSIVLFNQAAETITGYTQAEVLGSPLKEVVQILDEKSNQPSPDPLALLLGMQGDKSMTDHLILLSRDGNRLLISCSSAQIRNLQGEPVGYVMVNSDITERKRMEAQLALSQKMESIGQLAAGIAHEINTPMQYVGDNTHFFKDAFDAFSKALQEDDRLIQETLLQNASVLKENVDQVRQELDLEFFLDEVPAAIQQSLDGIDRVRKIVLAMKSFSHPGQKEKHNSDINQAIETTVTISHNEWKYVADLETQLDPDLPLVYCDVDEINQVVLNMIINAVHAIQDAQDKRGAGKGKITIQTGAEGENVMIKIQDTGMGIPQAILDRIFDPFFTTKEVGKGTGQGLSLAHNIIVNSHKGHIQVESEIGAGTLFTISLPIQHLEPEEES